VVKEEVVVLVVLVRRHRHAVGIAVRRAVGDEVPGAVEEETGPATVLSGAPRAPRPPECDACTCPWSAWYRRCSTRRGSARARGRLCRRCGYISANAPITKTNTRPPLLARPRRAPRGSAVYGVSTGGARGEPGYKQQAEVVREYRNGIHRVVILTHSRGKSCRRHENT
jgi:hypothetical protein